MVASIFIFIIVFYAKLIRFELQVTFKFKNKFGGSQKYETS